MSDKVYNVQLVPPIRGNDHYTVNCEFVTAVSSSPESSQQLVYNFRKAIYESLAQNILRCNRNAFFAKCRSVNDYWITLFEYLTASTRVLVPQQ